MQIGALERYMITRSELGIYQNVAVTARYGRRQQTGLRLALFAALSTVIQQHPVLSAIPVSNSTEAPYFARLSHIDLSQAVQFVELDLYGGAEQESSLPVLDSFLQEKHNLPFEYTTPLSPFWRIHVFEDRRDTKRFTLSFIFHHSIADTKSALVVLEDIEAALNFEVYEIPSLRLQSPNTPLLPPLDVFRRSQSAPSFEKTTARSDVEWSGSRQFVPVTTKFRSYWLSAATTYQLVALSKARGFTLTPVLQALLAAATFQVVPEQYTVLKVDCPVSLRSWLLPPIDSKSVGCYIDNFSTKYRRGEDFWVMVRETQTNIDRVSRQKQGDNLCGNIDQIEDLRTWFQGKIGNMRPGALELSNVGRLHESSRTKRCDIETLLFSQSAGACSSAIKVSAVTGRDNRLTLGFSWQEGAVGDDIIETLISEFTKNIKGVIQVSG